MKTALTLALVTLTLASAANAAALSYNNGDTAGSGVAEAAAGNFHVSTTGAGDKASLYFFKSDATPLGTFGDLSTFSFDYKVNTNTTPVAASAPAIRFFLSNGTSLVWENAYQAVQTTDTAWHTADLATGGFWQRKSPNNYDQIANIKDLASWKGGFVPTSGANTGVADSPSLLISSIQVSFGSGIGGSFDGYVNNISMGFGGASPATFTAAVPEPTTLAALAGTSVLGLRRRRA